MKKKDEDLYTTELIRDWWTCVLLFVIRFEKDENQLVFHAWCAVQFVNPRFLSLGWSERNPNTLQALLASIPTRLLHRFLAQVSGTG